MFSGNLEEMDKLDRSQKRKISSKCFATIVNFKTYLIKGFTLFTKKLNRGYVTNVIFINFPSYIGTQSIDFQSKGSTSIDLVRKKSVYSFY